MQAWPGTSACLRLDGGTAAKSTLGSRGDQRRTQDTHVCAAAKLRKGPRPSANGFNQRRQLRRQKTAVSGVGCKRGLAQVPCLRLDPFPFGGKACCVRICPYKCLTLALMGSAKLECKLGQQACFGKHSLRHLRSYIASRE